MTKKELCIKTGQELGIEPSQVQDILNRLTKNIKREVAAGGGVYIRGFASIVPVKRANKLARNIHQGTSLEIPAHYVPVFRPAKEFKRTVKQRMSTPNQ